MSIVITHEFAAHHLTGLQRILEGTKTLDEFLRKLRKYAKENRSRRTPAGEQDATELKIIGDGFETFGEVFIKSNASRDGRILIKDFKRPSIIDNGVDGIGVDPHTGARVFVQFKCYNAVQTITGENIDSFMSEIHQMIKDDEDAGIKQTVRERAVVITSCAGLHKYTHEIKYRKRIMCLNRDDLHRLVDFGTFWDEFRELVK